VVLCQHNTESLSGFEITNTSRRFKVIHLDVLMLMSSSRNQFRLIHHLLSNYLIYRLHVSACLGHHQAFTIIVTHPNFLTSRRDDERCCTLLRDKSYIKEVFNIRVNIPTNSH
jgi:hypothetical protein